MSQKILVVDDKQPMRDAVGATLQRAGFRPVAAADGAAALLAVEKHRPAVVVTDLKMPEMTGLELLAKLREQDDAPPVVLMTAYGSVGDAVEAMRIGAFDFIQKPFEGDELVAVVRRAAEHGQVAAPASSGKPNASASTAGKTGSSLVGDSPAMQRLARQVQRVAASSGTVLIHGESGTGKEVIARTLHAQSPRNDRPMLCVNCAALSQSLLESELFGHERGAFTGADTLRKGRFELADGGTLLLDEVSEISPGLQAKLLRVLQEGCFERVGSSQTISVDVRIIATTNRDLTRSVADGSFRQDLYYRLNVLPLMLPPLRERLDDVVPLAEHFLTRAGRRDDLPVKTISDEAAAVMRAYAWPGNVRELQNICERAHVLAMGETVEAELLRPWLVAGVDAPAPASMRSTPPAAPPVPFGTLTPGGSPPLQPPVTQPVGTAFASPVVTTAASDGDPADPIRPLDEVEREQIIRTLDHFGGNRARSAKSLGIGVRTLGLKLKKWKEQNLVAQSL